MSIYGWRWWDISKAGALTSVNGVIWEPNDPIRAECLPYRTGYGSSGIEHHDKILYMPDGREKRLTGKLRDTPIGVRRGGARVEHEEVPAFNCHCGFWAYWDPEAAFGLPGSHGNGYLRSTKVFGVIEAWGDIVHQELGFRCEYAIVRAVVVRRGKLHPAYVIPRYRTTDEICEVWDIEPVQDA